MSDVDLLVHVTQFLNILRNLNTCNFNAEIPHHYKLRGTLVAVVDQVLRKKSILKIIVCISVPLNARSKNSFVTYLHQSPKKESRNFHVLLKWWKK